MEAIIDVGSNSVRLNIYSGGQVIFRDLKTTRLGQGLTHDGYILYDNMLKSVVAISAFIGKAREYDAKTYIFGTAAVRGAKNSQEFLDMVEQVTGQVINVLSGEEEAKIGFIGGTNKSKIFPCGIIDIGGASTEIAVGTQENITEKISVDVGAVKAYETNKEDEKSARKYIDGFFKSVSDKNDCKKWYGIGGTCTSIASILSKSEVYDQKITDGFIIEREKLRLEVKRLFDLKESGRKKITAISKERADIIACGALILLTAMDKLNIDKIESNETDNLYGYLLTYVESKKE